MPQEKQENRWAITCPTCQHRYTWTGPLSPVPPCPRCKPALTPLSEIQFASEIKEALDLAAEIESLAGELPEAGAEFGDSVTEKAQDIASNIRAHNRVTENQYDALSNMLDGLNRWFGD